MNLKLALVGLFAALFAACGASAQTRVILTDTSATTWTVPDDFYAGGAYVELIGGAAQGGGAYAKKLNPAIGPGQVIAIQVGEGGQVIASGEASCFLDCTYAKAAGAVTSTGGTTASSVGDTRFAGGDGFAAPQGAGGGAGGPGGAGGNAILGTGGAGGGGGGGAGGVGANDGANGAEWGSAGSGGGGGGGTTCVCSGGNYGAGATLQANRVGAQGVIVISYYPRRRLSSGVF